jgi:hypothetical protein
MFDWHSDKLFARSDSFVACAAERMPIVADLANSCSRQSDQLVIVPGWIGTLTSCSRVPTPSSPALQSGCSSLLTSQAPAVVRATSSS